MKNGGGATPRGTFSAVQPSRTSGAPAAATYRGNAGTFLRTAGWAVLLDVAPDHPLVNLCWDRLATTADPEDVLGTILGLGQDQGQGSRPGQGGAPGFVLVREKGERRVVAQGLKTLVLDGEDVLGERSAEAWVDLPLTDASTVEAAVTASGPSTAPTLPLRDGAVVAGGFSLVLDDMRPDLLDDARGDALDDTGVDDTGVDERLRETRRVRATGDPTLPVAFTGGLATTLAPGGGDPGRTGPGSPRVLAAVCPAGHLTPAYSVVCRVCRRAVPAQETFETARPALGRLVLPGGGSLLLDRGVVLGREPHVPAGWVGPLPHLVALPDPDHDVSAQHVVVLLDLWNVLVCDLGSTNGTALVDEAGQVTGLRPYEPIALGPGSAVVLAEVVTLVLEAHP